MSRMFAHKVLSFVLLISLLLPAVPPAAAYNEPGPDPAPAAKANAGPGRPAAPPPPRAPGCFWADFNCDHLVDVFDFVTIAQGWNCSLGDGCFVPAYDVDGDDRVGMSDIMKVTAEFDPELMQFNVATPVNGQVFGGATVHVSGTASDHHPVTVTVDGQNAPLSNGQFALDVPVDPGNQVITVVATNVLETRSEQRQVAVDAAGPQIEVIEPQDGQAVYTTTPAIDIHYSDYDSQVNTTTLAVLVQPVGGSPLNITGSLTVEPGRAYGAAPALQQDTSYTMTVTLHDTLANETVLVTTFYVPLDPGSIIPPEEPPAAGWVSGVIYDSTTCDEYLTTCQGLAGAQVTMAAVDVIALEAVRKARQDEIKARLAKEGPFEPLPPLTDARVTTPVSGTVMTGPDGFFAFPVADTGMYWLRVEKEGYTYGQREAEIVKERSTATNAIYLTPIDSAVTPCGPAGCNHTSSDGTLQVVIPPGAIPAGQALDVTATNFEQVEFLPSGELPPGTWETYAFNLGGESDYQFQQPVLVRIRNDIGFAPGTLIPLGYWNGQASQWEHAGRGAVDPTGQWIEMSVNHFSNFDCNDPLRRPELEDHTVNKSKKNDTCSGGVAGCFINLGSGSLEEWIDLPPVGGPGANSVPQLRYSTERSASTAVIDVELNIDPMNTVVGNHIGWELFIQGRKTDKFTFSANLNGPGEVGRFRYHWNGRNADGELMPPGIHEYTVRMTIPFRGEYCYSRNGIFGNPPDCSSGATGIFLDAIEPIWIRGTVKLDYNPSQALGFGWVLDEQQHLYTNDAGQIMISDGEQQSEYYFSAIDRRYRADRESAHDGNSDRGSITELRQVSAQQRALESRLGTVGVEIASPAVAEYNNISSTSHVNDQAQIPSLVSTIDDGALLRQEMRSTMVSEVTTTAADYSSQADKLFLDDIWHFTKWEAIDASIFNANAEMKPSALFVSGPIGSAAPEGLPTPTTNPLSQRLGSAAKMAALRPYHVELGPSQQPVTLTAVITGTPSTIVTATLPVVSPNTNVCGTISATTTWTLAGSPYQMTCNVTVASGVVLTIEAGVLVMGQSGTNLTVNGQVQALGTSGQGIVFTSTSDSGPNQWNGILANLGTVNLEYVTVRYAGTGVSSGSSSSASLIITNSAISNNGARGISVTNGSLSVSNSTISNNGSDGIYTNNPAGLSVIGSSFTNNTGNAIRFGTGSVIAPSLAFSGNIASGNNINGIWIGGSLGTMTLPVDLPYVVSSFTVPAGQTLTIQPGTVIKFNYGNNAATIYGHLDGQGTANNPVVFTSIRDDSLGGDTNNDGSATLPARGDWDRLHVYSGASLNLKHTTVRYGSYSAQGVIRNGGGAVYISDCSIADSRYPLYQTTGTAILTNTHVISNTYGIYIPASSGSTAALNITGGTISNNGSYGIFVTNASLSVSNSAVSHNGSDGIYANNPTALSVTGSSFVNNVGSAIRFDTGSIIAPPLVFNGNNASDNSINGIKIGGNLGTIALPADLPYVVDTLTVPTGQTLIIRPNTIVKVSVSQGSGSSIYVQGRLDSEGTADNPVVFTSIRDDSVGGDTNNDGSVTQPALGDWSRLKIDPGASLNLTYTTVRYGGYDIFGGIGAINAYSPISLTISNSVIEKNWGPGLAVVGSASPIALRRVKIAENSSHGIRITGGYTGQFTMYGSNISDNTGFGLEFTDGASTGTILDARFNWWGDPAGPYHPTTNPTGLGDQVSDNVNYEPWLTVPLFDLTGGAVNLTETDYTKLTYDVDSDTYTRAYPNGRLVHFNSDGSHDYTLEPDGRKTSYTYNSDGSVTTMAIIPPGRTSPTHVWSFAYHNGKLTSIADPAGRVINFTIDDHGNLVQVAFPDDTTRRFRYDARGLMTQQTDQNGAITSYSYNSYGGIREAIYPPRAIYDPVTGQTIVRQEVRSFIPADTGYPIINDSIQGTPANPAPGVPRSQDLVVKAQYGRSGQSGHVNEWSAWLDEADGLGRTTTYDRNERNNVLKQAEPDGDCIEYTYDNMGNALTESRLPANQCELVDGERNPSLVQTWTRTYEPRFNQLKTETDPLGHTTRYVYDYEEGTGEVGKLIRIEYPQVQDDTGALVTPTVRYTYNALGLLEAETDERGVVTKYLYSQGTPDEAYGQPGALFAQGATPVPGLLTRVIQDFGDSSHLNVTTITRDFDGAGNAMTLVAPNGAIMRYTFDAMGHKLTETNALEIATKYEYDGKGNLVRQVRDYTPDGITGRNIVTDYAYDFENRLVSEKTAADGLVLATLNSYDIDGMLGARTDGNGNTTRYVYDGANQRTAEIDPLDNTTMFAYADDGELISTTGPDGSVTHYEYDGLGRRIKEIVDFGGLNLTTTYGYDSINNLVSVIDPIGTVICSTYDALTRQTSDTRDCGGLDLTTTFVYDVGGNLLRSTNERDVVLLKIYDTLGRMVSMHSDATGLNLPQTYNYDAMGNLVSSTDERGIVTSYTYNAINQLTRTCGDAGGLNLCTAYTYDRLGNRLTSTDPNGIVTRSETNAFGRPSRTVDDDGGLNAQTLYVYDNNLNLIAITDDNGNTTRYSYDGRNQLTQTRYADGSTITNTYNPNGTLATRQDQAGVVVTHTYDGAHRLVGKSYPDSSSQAFAYDAAGRPTSADQTMSGHTTQVTFVYNALGDVTSSTQTVDGLSWTTGYAYDYPAGRTTTTYPSGIQVTHTLDALGRLQQVTKNGAMVATYTYNDLAGTTTLTHANGVSTVTDTDPLRRITRVHTYGTQEIADYRYGYDAAGNRIYMQRWHRPAHPADVYQYDGMYQVTRVWYGANATSPGAITSYDHLQWYDLDTVFNRLEVQNDGASEVYLPNNGQQLTNRMNRYEQVGSAMFSYDPRGNLTGDSLNLYTYDVENRQIGMSGPIGDAEYIYDSRGWRVGKVVGNVATYYVYNTSYQIIEERDGGNQVLANYILGDYVDEPLKIERAGSSYSFHRDALGNVAEVSNQTGSLVERYAYDVYGKPYFFDGVGNPLAASGIDNTWLFTARQYDVESRNYHYRTREYNPGIGRFQQVDSLGFVAGMNQYATYLVTNKADPFGLGPCVDAKMLGWDEGDGGGIVCKNGKKHLCIWVPTSTNRGIRNCIMQHELVHEPDTENCRCRGFYRITKTMPERNQAESECRAFTQELNCLFSKMEYHCKQGSEAEKQSCQMEFMERMTRVEERANYYCVRMRN